MNEFLGEGSWERPEDKDQQLGYGGKMAREIVTAAEIPAEALGPVQPGLNPAQGSLLIKHPFNPGIFCLGVE